MTCTKEDTNVRITSIKGVNNLKGRLMRQQKQYIFGKAWVRSLFIILSLFLFSSCGEKRVKSEVIISTEGDLIKFSNSLRAGEFTKPDGQPIYVVLRLKDDIELTKPFTPIGDEKYPFFGYFDGQHHTIKNLEIISDSSACVAMFGYAKDSRIQNFKLEDVNVKGSFEVAGVCGYIYGTIIMNCEVSGNISGEECVGGIAGEVSYSTIDDCKFTGTVSGKRYSVGGIAGSFEFGAAMRCKSRGVVNGDCGVDNIVGSNSECLIIECSSDAEVKSNRDVVSDYDHVTKLLFTSL